MSIFNFIRSFKNKGKVTVDKISLETQLEKLASLGIYPKDEDFMEWISDEWGRDSVEYDPYNLLLFSLGGEREVDNTWKPLSEEVYSFDTECVEDDDSYQIVLERLVALTKGEVEISDISSMVNHEDGTSSLSFRYKDNNYQWDLDYEDDWFDHAVISKINGLLKETNSTKYFYACSPDQTLTVIYAARSIVDELNNIVSSRFELQ